MSSTGNEEDFQAFLKMDLKSTPSVLCQIPLVEGRGRTKMIPHHIRGCSANPREVMKKMREFRKMRQHQQESQQKEVVTRKEQREHGENLKQLVMLRSQLLLGNAKAWDDVALPVDCNELLEHAENRRKRKKKRKHTTVIQQPGGGGSSPSGRVNTSTQLRTVSPVPPATSDASDSNNSAGLATRDAAAGNDHADGATVPGTRDFGLGNGPADGATLHDADVGNNAGDAAADNGAEGATVPASGDVPFGGHISLVSSREDRAAYAAKQRKKAKSRKGRQPGSLSTRVFHMSDATSNEKVDAAMKAVALAADTIRPDNERNYRVAPREVCMIDINYCRDTPAHGGQTRDEDCRTVRPRVSIVGPKDRQHLKWVFLECLRAMKHEEDGDEFLYADDEGDLTLPVTERFIERRKRQRKGPSQTPRSATDTIEDRHARLDNEATTI